VYRNSSIDRTGVFATRDFEPGDVIMAEDPVLVGKTATMKTLEQFLVVYGDLLCQFEQLDLGTQV
jgi:hypothetical protein